MKVICLVENTSSDPRLEAEHGLSLYLEVFEKKILFDMGQSDLFWKNSEKLGVSLEQVDFAVLSHGHYDHGGGLRFFLEHNKKAPVYLSKHAFSPCYNAEGKAIGLDPSLKENPRLQFIGNQLRIVSGVSLLSCNRRKKRWQTDPFGLCVEKRKERVPDDFLHEQYLLVQENGKKVLISGCSHKGILNLAEWFHPDYCIGGFHFSKMPLGEPLKSFAKQLNEFHTDFYTCHCTGTEQYRYMQKQMDRLHYLSCGDYIEI